MYIKISINKTDNIRWNRTMPVCCCVLRFVPVRVYNVTNMENTQVVDLLHPFSVRKSYRVELLQLNLAHSLDFSLSTCLFRLQSSYLAVVCRFSWENYDFRNIRGRVDGSMYHIEFSYIPFTICYVQSFTACTIHK